jgi:hypothetical protein
LHAFIDYKKAFDSVARKFVLQALKNQGAQDICIKIIMIIYNHKYGKIKNNSEREEFRLERGVKKGDPISPKLFTCLLEHVFRILNWSNKHGLNINGRKYQLKIRG